jgi:hypothetical protein
MNEKSKQELLKTLTMAEETIVSLNTMLLFKNKHTEEVDLRVQEAMTKIENVKCLF